MTTHSTNKGKKIIAAISLFSSLVLVSSNVIAGYNLVELDDVSQHDQHVKHNRSEHVQQKPHERHDRNVQYKQHKRHNRYVQHRRHNYDRHDYNRYDYNRHNYNDYTATRVNNRTIYRYQTMPEAVTRTEYYYQTVPSTIIRNDVMENIITLTLTGATSYESVEIFHKLLNSVSSVDELERRVLYITPGRPQSSRATWKITTTDKDPFAIESELYELIKELDPLAINDSLSGLPFTPTPEEILEVKSIKPYSATAGTVTFTTGTVIPNHQTAHYYSDDYAPHLYQGFD